MKNKKIKNQYRTVLAVFMLLAVSVASVSAYTGSGDLIQTEVREGTAKITDIGDIIYSFDSPGYEPYGLAWDGNYLWHVDSREHKIYKIDPSNGNVISSFNSPGLDRYPTGLTYDGSYLWVANLGTIGYYNRIYKINPSNGNVISSFRSPDDWPSGLAWDGNYLWHSGYCDNKIYKIDPSCGNVISSFSSPDIWATGLTYDGSYLWSADKVTDKIYKINPSDGSVVDSFYSPAGGPTGLTWDGSYLWNADKYTDMIYKIDVMDPPDEPPTACYIWEDADGEGPGTVINFDASCSTDDNGIISYEWDWTSDGTYDDSYTTPYCSHDYGDAGNYDCTLKVTDTIGQTDTETKNVHASTPEDDPPIARYNWEDADGDGPGTVINFDAGDSTDDNGIISYEWDWTSDGTYDETGKIKSHDYGNTDYYDCTLRVTDTIGQTDTVTKTVHADGAGDILLTEGFEDGVMPPPGGWYTDNGNPYDPWKIVSKDEFPNAVHSGDYAAVIYSNISRTSNNWLISPELDLTGYPNVDLEFWAYSTTFFDGGTIKLHIMGDGFDDIIWDMIRDENWPLPPTYRKMTFNLNGYIGKTIRIGWQLTGRNGPCFGLDDITITDPEDGGGNQQQSEIYIFQETNVGMSTVSTQKMSIKQLEGVNK